MNIITVKITAQSKTKLEQKKVQPHKHKLHKHKERGFSMTATVMLLLAMGSLILGAINRQITASLRFNLQERDYLQAYNQALSALHWGQVQRWPALSTEWQCQKLLPAEFTACAKIVPEKIAPEKAQGLLHTVLLRGDSETQVGSQVVTLYRLMTLNPAETPAGKLYPTPRGWLDFCPLRQEVFCEP